MKENAKKHLPAFIGITATWFGIHVGSGFASGAQFNVYYMQYGWTAIFMPIVTWLILGISYYVIMEFGYAKKINSYKEYTQTFYSKNKIVGLCILIYFDLIIIATNFIGQSSVLAGTAALLQSSLGFNYWVGVFITAVIIVLCVMFGSKLLARIETVLTAFLIIVILLIGFFALNTKWENISYVIGHHVMAEGKSYWDAFVGAVLYASTQMTIMGVMCGLIPNMEDKKDPRRVALLGFLLNGAALVISGFIIIGYYPESATQSLPVYEALSKDAPALGIVYQIMLFLAFISTGAGCSWGLIARVKPYLMKLGLSERVSILLILLVILGVGAFGAKFGLMTIVAKGFTFLGKLTLPVILLPIFILGPYRLHQIKKESSEAEPTEE